MLHGNVTDGPSDGREYDNTEDGPRSHGLKSIFYGFEKTPKGV